MNISTYLIKKAVDGTQSYADRLKGVYGAVNGAALPWQKGMDTQGMVDNTFLDPNFIDSTKQYINSNPNLKNNPIYGEENTWKGSRTNGSTVLTNVPDARYAWLLIYRDQDPNNSKTQFDNIVNTYKLNLLNGNTQLAHIQSLALHAAKHMNPTYDASKSVWGNVKQNMQQALSQMSPSAQPGRQSGIRPGETSKDYTDRLINELGANNQTYQTLQKELIQDLQGAINEINLMLGKDTGLKPLPANTSGNALYDSARRILQKFDASDARYKAYQTHAAEFDAQAKQRANHTAEVMNTPTQYEHNEAIDQPLQLGRSVKDRENEIVLLRKLRDALFSTDRWNQKLQDPNVSEQEKQNIRLFMQEKGYEIKEPQAQQTQTPQPQQTQTPQPQQTQTPQPQQTQTPQPKAKPAALPDKNPATTTLGINKQSNIIGLIKAYIHTMC